MLVVEVDALYIKEMINHTDIQPNVSMNHWLVGIQAFDLKLCHVPATTHKCLNGLSH